MFRLEWSSEDLPGLAFAETAEEVGTILRDLEEDFSRGLIERSTVSVTRIGSFDEQIHAFCQELAEAEWTRKATDRIAESLSRLNHPTNRPNQ